MNSKISLGILTLALALGGPAFSITTGELEQGKGMKVVFDGASKESAGTPSAAVSSKKTSPSDRQAKSKDSPDRLAKKFSPKAPSGAPELPSAMPTPPNPPNLRNIAVGLGLAFAGMALISLASFGIGGVVLGAGSWLAQAVLRFLGVGAMSGGAEIIAKGKKPRALRGSLLIAGGVGGFAAAIGAFGPIGGLTAIALGVGGFFVAYMGIAKLSNSANTP